MQSVIQYVFTRVDEYDAPPGQRKRRREPDGHDDRPADRLERRIAAARDGHFEDDVPVVGGMFFKKADETLVADLVPSGRRATAYGLFAAVQGGAALVGGALAGALYERSLPLLVALVAAALASVLAR